MRTRKDIKNQITASFILNEYMIALYGLTEGKSFEEEFSLVSFENILFDILSYSIYLLEQLFNQHQKEVDLQLYNQKSGRLPWYRYMALKFQYGFDLITDSDEFDNTGYTAAQIEASKIIKYSAVNEGDVQGVIVIKIAGETDGKLAPISADAKTTAEAYFNEIKYAGSRINVINFLPDRLFLNLQIYRDPLVLDANGNSVVKGGNPVETAINEFMKELPFNGELVLLKLIDKLQLVEGVVIPNLLAASSSWIDIATNDYGQATVINVKRVPVSGYFEIVNFDNITYVV
jgi:hypothetical protein